ncbi:uncharacterized protein I303_107285 [Kwoniella dejecticola CBS 10117]|uniref:Cysteine-rich PDZ-binding protein n=1 Tax=Kwoniella dejecticola CBS 10117 TaxID=1296121 RepID=A0A1A5ZZ87_9TREE|nr:uncharacterized protein I303_06688 [Kwoniella dejecticola CBS 10117]OBR83129.1 hypothetical protein I303_06688 [Kwoniella dejecticola CBS 10117]
MVCKKCEKKLSTVAAPDPFKPSSSTRVIGENKLLSARAKSSPYAKPGGGGGGGVKKGSVNPYQKCIDCKQPAQQNNATRCQKCAYKKGLCAICGNLVLTDIARYKQTAK